MILWEREQQCRNCWHECGWEEVREVDEDGKVLCEHEFDCRLGNVCATDLECPEFEEEKG